MEEYKNLEEIVKLIEDEIDNNDDNVSAVLDLEDLKELRNLLARYKELEKYKKYYETEKIIWSRKDYIKKSKVKEKIDSKFKEVEGLYERGVQPQAQFTMKLLRNLEKELIED